MWLCVHYGGHNEDTVAEKYPIRPMDDCIDIDGDTNVLSTLDANCRYWKILIAGRDHYQTGFKTVMERYKCKRKPFVLWNAPETLKSALGIVLPGI